MALVAQDDGYWNATAQAPAFPKLEMDQMLFVEGQCPVLARS